MHVACPLLECDPGSSRDAGETLPCCDCIESFRENKA